MQQLETRRLVLRDFLLEDIDDFYEYAKNPKVGPMAGWKPHESKDETNQILTMFRRKQEVWAIYHKIDKKVIGSVGIHRKSVNNIYELGYVLAEPYWGKGIVVEACNEVLEYCFNELDINEIIVEHFSDNLQSKRVIEKLGFEYTQLREKSYTMYSGETKDCNQYKLVKEKYNAKTKRNI